MDLAVRMITILHNHNYKDKQESYIHEVRKGGNSAYCSSFSNPARLILVTVTKIKQG